MITLISGTNRKNSLTQKFSQIYFQMLTEKEPESMFYDLSDLPPNLIDLDPYFYDNRPEKLLAIQNEFFTPASKFILIVPEYNGSFPGILKLLIDVLEPKPAFYGKKAAITGIATGRAGNLRGMDHLCSVLQHMGVTVLPFMLPVSRAQHEITEDSVFTEATQKMVQRQIHEFFAF
jgi:chromate reductase, NAD(P)H dehydrogenase (quinone)